MAEANERKHEEYQQKLATFKSMQDHELKLTSQLREENKALREDNDKLRDEA